MIRTLSLCGLAAALLLLAAVPASAVMIDSFDNTAVVAANAGSPLNSTITPTGGFLGTNRTLEAAWASGANDVDGEIDPGGNSLLNVSLGAATLGSVSVTWDNIGGVDLTAGATLNAIGMEIVFDDLPAGLLITMTDGSANTGSASIITAGGIFVPTNMTLLFASFSGSIDFSDIETISLQASATLPATDLQIGFIESVLVVPEPGTTLLLGFGLLGLLGATRTRR